MAKKSKSATKKAKAKTIRSASRPSVTPERFSRLYRFIELLAAGPQTRTTLTRKLKLDVRGFYRDLEVLRTSGLGIALQKGKYHLAEDGAEALAMLPFPDPQWTFGEATSLAKGRTSAHQRLKNLIKDMSE